MKSTPSDVFLQCLAQIMLSNVNIKIHGEVIIDCLGAPVQPLKLYREAPDLAH
jgi:hypothetical protein